LTIEGVEDQSGNEIDEVTVNVDLDDNDGPRIPAKVYYEETSGKNMRLYLEFKDDLVTSGFLLRS
jgi:hypothetical protein